MSPRIHEIQARINASIHGRNYNPIEPPGKTSISRISRRERERLEIYGDALLSYKLVSFLFHEFPSHGPHFISTIKSALLSNLTFAKLLMKAHGYLDPRGFDKTVADDFETMAALCYFEYGPKKFEVWFHNTFVPLVNDAACLWPDAASYEEERSTDSRDKRRHSVHHSSTSVSPIEESSLRNAPKRSWVEACIEVATLPVNPTLSSLLPPVELPRTRRRDEEEQPLYKRGWAEAMEVAGNEDRPPQSSWVEAMARTCEPNPLTKKNKKKAQNMHEKENCPPLPPPVPRKGKSRWDVRRISDPIPSPSSATIRESYSTLSVDNALHISEVSASVASASGAPELVLDPTNPLRTSQISNMSLPSAPTPYPLPPFEPVFEPELLEPLHDIETPASVSLALPPLDCANTEMGCQDEEPSSWERAGTCSPMEISPICSPTKFLSLSPPCADLPIRETAFWDHQCELIALRLDSNPAGRRRSDSLSSTSSSMAISACSSPTKFISFGQEPPLPPAKQAPPDILCSLIHRGLTGESEHDPDLHLSQDCCPLTSSMRPETENVGVAQESMFWPGRSFVFTYAQYRRKPLQSLVQLD